MERLSKLLKDTQQSLALYQAVRLDILFSTAMLHCLLRLCLRVTPLSTVLGWHFSN